MPDAVPALTPTPSPPAGAPQQIPAAADATAFPQFLAALLGIGSSPAVQPEASPEEETAPDEGVSRTLPRSPGAPTGAAAAPVTHGPRLAPEADAESRVDASAKGKPASRDEVEPATLVTSALSSPLPAAPVPEQAVAQHQLVPKQASGGNDSAEAVTVAAKSPMAVAPLYTRPQEPMAEGREAPAPSSMTAEPAAVSAPPPPRATEPAPPAAAVSPSSASGPPSPAAQVAAPLFALSQRDDGAQRITLRLEPADLGQVRIHIDRAADAPPRVEIAVERPETMTLLLRDQGQLQHALDRAGVPAEGRMLEIHLAPPDPQPAAPSLGAGGADAGPAGGGSGTPNRQQPQSARQDQPQQEQTAAGGSPPPWLRAGLDITA